MNIIMITIIVKLKTIAIILVNTMDQINKYHLIINHLAKEFEGEFNCLEENTKPFQFQ